jgi:hypothetical protein
VNPAAHGLIRGTERVGSVVESGGSVGMAGEPDKVRVWREECLWVCGERVGERETMWWSVGNGGGE